MRCHSANPGQVLRRGATLTEVLLSMMILSIGVLALASLFPIGILSSVRATQLTNAVALKQNALAQIQVNPGFVLDPDQDFSPMFGTDYNYIIDPLAFVPLLPPAGAAPATPIKVFDEDKNNNFRIDQGEDANGNGKLDSLYRYHAGYNTRAIAEAVATLPDSWTELTTSVPVALTATNVRLDHLADLTAAQNVPPEIKMRVVLLDPTSARSHTANFENTGVVTPTPPLQPQLRQITWDPLRPLTTTPAAITEVRVEQQDTKYSYLLTVRRKLDEDRDGDLVLDPGEDINGNGFLDRGNGSASVDVVVYHRRDFNLAAEIPLYSSSGFVKDENSVMVTVPKDLKYKSGGYLLDATNLRWYRIESSTITAKNSASAEVLFTLQQPIIEDANPNPPLPGRDPVAVILTSHVIQVFQLGEF